MPGKVALLIQAVLIALLFGGCAGFEDWARRLRIGPREQVRAQVCYEEATDHLSESERAYRNALDARVRAGEISHAYANQLWIEYQTRLEIAREQAWAQCQRR